MYKSNMEQDILKVLHTEEEIKKRVEEMGAELYDKFHDKDPLFVGVLNGCFIFMADLVRASQMKSQLEFIAVSSYKNSTVSSGAVQLTRDLQCDITGRHLIVVEDILDSGNTLSKLTEILRARGVRSLKIVSLLDKPARHTHVVPVEYTGFVIPDKFVVGYGLDYQEKHRNLPYVGVVEFTEE